MKEERHNLAMYHLQLALVPSLLHIVEGEPIAKKSWECLQRRFGEKENDINESTMSQKVNPTLVVEDSPTICESLYENALMDDEQVNEEKEDKQVDLIEVEVEQMTNNDEEELNATYTKNLEEARDKDEAEGDGQEEVQAQDKNKDDNGLRAHIEEEMEEVDETL